MKAKHTEIDKRSKQVEPKTIEWYRDIHQHPELAFEEVRTAKQVAEHLTSLGMAVETNIAETGVVGILRGMSDTPVVGLRADMDALPVTEKTGLPYASKVKALYKGEMHDIMHACGHDAHTAILMGAAEVLAGMRDRIPGTVKFIFQPAEEGAGGARRMIEEGVLEDPAPQAMFGLHIGPFPSTSLVSQSGPLLASADNFYIKVKGRQTHSGVPWMGIDPIVVSSQIVLGLQTIISRQLDLTKTPGIISIGKIQGGTRYNVIPEEVEFEGTLRIFDQESRLAVHKKIEKTAKAIAEASDATAEVTIVSLAPVTYNDPGLYSRMEGTLKRLTGTGEYLAPGLATGAEDFSYYTQEVPSLFFFLGTIPEGGELIPNHSPYFKADENNLILGVRAMSSLAVDFLESCQ